MPGDGKYGIRPRPGFDRSLIGSHVALLPAPPPGGRPSGATPGHPCRSTARRRRGRPQRGGPRQVIHLQNPHQLPRFCVLEGRIPVQITHCQPRHPGRRVLDAARSHPRGQVPADPRGPPQTRPRRRAIASSCRSRLGAGVDLSTCQPGPRLGPTPPPPPKKIAQKPFSIWGPRSGLLGVPLDVVGRAAALLGLGVGAPSVPAGDRPHRR